jgi:hypothetical protein
VKIREGLSEQAAFEIERAFIAAIGRFPDGPLVNLTDGGEGLSGHRHTAETKAKIGAKIRGRKQTPEEIAQRAAAQRGRPKTPEHAAKISLGLTGIKFTDDRRLAISQAMTGKKFPGRILSEEAKLNLRLKNLGKKASDSTRAKMRSAQLAKWAERRA